MAPEATRTGSFPAISVSRERPSPPPSPPHGTPEWFAWATKQIEAHARDIAIIAATSEHLTDQIGRPPIPAAKDPGAGMWLVLADVRTDCTRILEKLDAADAASATWAARVGRVGWRIVETMIPLAIGAALLWLSGHWR